MLLPAYCINPFLPTYVAPVALPNVILGSKLFDVTKFKSRVGNARGELVPVVTKDSTVAIVAVPRTTRLVKTLKSFWVAAMTCP
jgi:hypothetical protein